jgi:AcrR family transcriptional regulator
MSAQANNNSSHTPVRADGTLARKRLLDTALRLFAEKGYQKTSTREIADQAGVNLGAISYYFGDKPGLYRAAFCESCCDTTNAPDIQLACDCVPDHRAAGLSPAEALGVFFRNFLQPLKQGDQVRLFMRLHFRELVEPSGVLGNEMEEDMAALFRALAGLVADALTLPAADPDALRLTHAVMGVAIHFFVAQDLVEQTSPQLVARPDDIDTLADRLALYAEGMIAAETHRRTHTGSSR